MARRPYLCTGCGLRVAGRVDPVTGNVYAYDRSATTDGPTIPCICAACQQAQPTGAK